MNIRKYKDVDRKAVEHIHFETYFFGKSMASIIDDERIVSRDICYYFKKEKDNIFLAEENNKVFGYIIACEDNKRYRESYWALRNLALNSAKYFFMSKKDKRFVRSRFKLIWRALRGLNNDGNLKVPRNAGHIHINLLPEARGKGAGSELMKKMFAHLKKKGVKKIHADSFDTNLNDTKGFWAKHGFKEYSRIKTESWKEYLPKEKIDLVCYYREL